MNEMSALRSDAQDPRRATSVRGIDPAEISHYNLYARETSEAEHARRWLHKYNPVRVGFLRDSLSRHEMADLPDVRILDIGCGTGVFCEALAREGARVTGLDPASEAVALARRSAQKSGLSIDYRKEPIEDLDETFDAVAAMEVIEHVPDPAHFLRECAARVRPGGIFVLSTINRTMKSRIYAILMAEYVLRLLPRGSHQWNRFVRPHEVEEILAPIGFGEFDCRGVTMNLRSGDLQLSSDCSVNYLFSARRLS